MWVRVERRYMSQETETETETGAALDIDREQYVPDWIVEEAVGLALQTQLREPILEAVRSVDIDDSGSDGDSIDVQAVGGESTDEGDAGGGGGRLRGVVGLVAVAVGLFVAYRVLSKKRDEI